MPGFRPPDTGAGTPLGNSYLSAWSKCPRYWFNTYYRPQLLDGTLYRGIVPRFTKEPFLRGSLIHEALAEWYRSGVRDGEDTGERDLDRALAIAEAHSSERAAEHETEDLRQDLLNKTKIVMRKYHELYGPGGPKCEFGSTQIVCDDQGQPLVERDWAFPLGNGYLYTCRTDAIITHHGMLKSYEHKTTTTRGLRIRLHTIPMDSQFPGEQWILEQLFPDELMNGTLVNIIQQDVAWTASKKDLRVTETTHRTALQLERWRRSAISILNQIEDSIGRFEASCEAGVATETAIDQCFPDLGTRTGHCTAYFGHCEFFDLCEWAGHELAKLPMYRPRAAVDVGPDDDDPNGDTP